MESFESKFDCYQTFQHYHAFFAENFGNLILNIEFSERCEYLPSCCNNEIHNIPSLTHIRILMNNEAHSQNFEDCFDCKND